MAVEDRGGDVGGEIGGCGRETWGGRLRAERTGISLSGFDPLAELTGGLNAPSYSN
jgi:hypothetical protein